MKFLYVAPEHISGTLTTLRKAHEEIGDIARFLTLFQNQFGFDEDIVLNLPLSPTGGLFAKAKEFRRRMLKQPLDPERPTPAGIPPLWQPDDKLSAWVFKSREALWTPLIERAKSRYQLNEFDIYQFEMGMEFYRDGRWVKELLKRGKGTVAFYHGTDVRNRGVIKAVDDHCRLRLTSELDLITLHPKLNYLYLPYDLSGITPNQFVDKPEVFRIGHAARNRRLKGTDAVIRAVESLKHRGFPVELVLIENVSHEEAIRRKKTCHLAVDQLTDLGGWGYGMSSIEFLAMGIPVVTKFCEQYRKFLPDHPFELADEQNVETALEHLIADSGLRHRQALAGRGFVEKYHDVRVVLRHFYEYLLQYGMVQKIPDPLKPFTPPPVRI